MRFVLEDEIGVWKMAVEIAKEERASMRAAQARAEKAAADAKAALATAEAAQARAEKAAAEARAEAAQAKAEKAAAAAAQAKAEKAAAAAEAARAEEARNSAEASSSADAPDELASKQFFSKTRRELHLNKTVCGVKLTPQMVQERFDKLEARRLTLAPRYQEAEARELASLRENFKGILAEAASSVNAHTASEVAGVHSRLDRLDTRLSGFIPERREGQTATERKSEIDEVLPALRRERQACVEEERAAKAARRG